MTPQELKNSILWNAIQGKLTKQNKMESAQQIVPILFREVDTPDDAYFDIPDNWCWCKIGKIFKLVNGKAFKPTDWSEEGLPIVRIQNLNDIKAPYNYFSGEIEDKYILSGGELLFSWSGTPGTSFGAYIWEGGKAVLNQHIFIVYPQIELDYRYVKYALNGELKIFIDKAHGGAGLKHITKKEFEGCLLPVPPLAEQKRIVAKIEELIPYIDRYEQAWSKLDQFNSRFPEDMKKSLLQYAIQGKMVEQRPEEGSAEELFAQVQQEKQRLIAEKKIKKEKPLPEITEDEKPFDIPESWMWVRLGSIISISSGDGLTSKEMDGSGIYPVYGGNGINGHHNSYNVSKKTLVIGRVGFYCGSTHITDDKAWVTDNAFITTFDENRIDMKWLKFYIDYLNPRKKASSTAQPVISGKLIYPMLVPLPPLAEQKRIVEKLEQLLPLCERLK